MLKIELVPLDKLKPAAYNPREADPDRLNLLETSLRKLGFVLPLYALRDGHLMSGHQRLTVAERMGCKVVPVVYVDTSPDKLQGVNILFNRRLEVSEPVATPTGWRAIGSLRVGDHVIGADGGTHRVTNVTERERRQMYRVEFDDGVVILADDEHLWTVDYTTAGGGTGYSRTDTVTTGQVAMMLSDRRRVSVRPTAPVILEDKDLPVDPWLLGMFLGDGNITEHGVRLCSEVPVWCFEKVSRVLPDGVEARVDQTQHATVKSVRFVAGDRGGENHNPMVATMRYLGLAGLTAREKFIPESYLWASIEQRLALLQGLMDSDGCVGPSGKTPIYTSTSRSLAEGVVFLARSLGGKAALRTMRRARGAWSEAFQVTVRLPNGVSCFSNPTKIAAQKVVTPRLRRRIVSVTPDRVAEAVCISIDSADHLYLAAGFIPTHNCTNDMRSIETSDTLAKTLPLHRLQELLDAVPDKTPDHPDFYRCAHAEEVPVDDLFANLARTYESNAVGICRKLQTAGVFMPAVLDPTGKVINGSFRLMALAETKPTLERQNRWPVTFPAVRLSKEEAELADLLLNLVSMKFTVEKQYADLLRWGAFRRQENKVVDLPQSFRILVNNWKASSAKDDLDESDKFWNEFRKQYGEVICDFGAGQRRVKPLLEQKGIFCSEFEPYPCDWRGEIAGDHRRDLPNLELSRLVTDRFLADVAAGAKYSSVVLAAVLNSVPFHYDRMCVLAIAHSLCSFGGQVVGQGRSPENTSSVNYLKNRTDPDGHHLPAPSTFVLEYEPNTTIGNVGMAPKVQRAHSVQEVKQMLSTFFETVQVTTNRNYWWMLAKNPKRINPAILAKAVAHEFNLPFKNGTQMDSIDRREQALDAFSTRLGIDLRKHLK